MCSLLSVNHSGYPPKLIESSAEEWLIKLIYIITRIILALNESNFASLAAQMKTNFRSP